MYINYLLKSVPITFSICAYEFSLLVLQYFEMLGSDGKGSAYNAGDLSSIPGS